MSIKSMSLIGSFRLSKKEWLVFLIILTIGIFARAWNFASMPPGLNVDEASIGIEAYDLYKFGIDRNAVSYPVHLISWGSGQNAFYAYLLIPFILINGLNAFTIRLPMMLASVLSLPLMYLSGTKLGGKRFGLLAMFFMAISPWHIVNARWAVESNILPFLFLAGFTLMLYAAPSNRWFLASCVFFALSLYAYGTAYLGVPVFLAFAIPLLLRAKRIALKQTLLGLAVFAALALPIALFVLINTFELNEIHLGALTIPRMPVQARYEAMAAVFGEAPLRAMWNNALIMLKLLWTQEDAFAWNFVAPFGYFYKMTSAFAALGFLWLILPRKAESNSATERSLLTLWLCAALAIGILHPTNLTRLNLIFTPILFLIAFFIFELNARIKYALPAALAALSIAFVFFLLAYHGAEYRKRAAAAFNEGILPAIEYAREKSPATICFTESTYSLYIYVLFSEKMNPKEYVQSLEWISPADPADPARTPRSMGRYRFTLSPCAQDPQAAYILLQKETPPNSNIGYKSKSFGKFQVFVPKR
ncbi:MAG: hypothetical protein Fur002_26660 [Anaerolineales bacterium]